MLTSFHLSSQQPVSAYTGAWRWQILEGVTQVSVYNSPGALSLWNDKSAAVLTSHFSEDDVILACGVVGKGRIFVATHFFYTWYFYK